MFNSYFRTLPERRNTGILNEAWCSGKGLWAERRWHNGPVVKVFCCRAGYCLAGGVGFPQREGMSRGTVDSQRHFSELATERYLTPSWQEPAAKTIGKLTRARLVSA